MRSPVNTVVKDNAIVSISFQCLVNRFGNRILDEFINPTAVLVGREVLCGMISNCGNTTKSSDDGANFNSLGFDLGNSNV